MNRAPSSNQIPDGFIAIDYHLTPHQIETDGTREKFKREMANIARWMAKTTITGHSEINRPLFKVLIKALQEVRFEAITTTSRFKHSLRREKTVFILRRIDDEPANFRKDRNPFIAGAVAFIDDRTGKVCIEHPHRGNVIFFTTHNQQRVIPHPASFIPVHLTNESVQTITGSIGIKIREAFYAGANDLYMRKKTKPALRHEGEIFQFDPEVINERLNSHQSRQTLNAHPDEPVVKSHRKPTSRLARLRKDTADRRRERAEEKRIALELRQQDFEELIEVRKEIAALEEELNSSRTNAKKLKAKKKKAKVITPNKEIKVKRERPQTKHERLQAVFEARMEITMAAGPATKIHYDLGISRVHANTNKSNDHEIMREFLRAQRWSHSRPAPKGFQPRKPWWTVGKGAQHAQHA